MKISKYNMKYCAEDGIYTFNTLTKSLLKVNDMNLANILDQDKNQCINEIPQEVQKNRWNG